LTTFNRYSIATLLVGFYAVVGCLFSTAHAAGFVVDRANTVLRDDVFYIDANINFQFSEKSLEALDNGVPLTIQIDFEVRRTLWKWSTTVVSVSARYELAVHAFSRHYVVRNLNLGTAQSFASLDGARLALGQVRDFPLVDNPLLAPDVDYTWRVRASLDIEALPAPLRPLAYLSSLWRHDSIWYEWPLHR
jgi:hypothetical protein